jgi:cysteinyl-tRNA synthetase
MFLRRLIIALSLLLAGTQLCLGAPEAAKRAKAADKDSANTAETAHDPQRTRREALAGVKSWAIQLRYLNRAEIAAAPIDLIVIDHAPHPKKDVEIPFAPNDLTPLKTKANGGRRIVLAYLSIGEAERYRYYWNPAWDAAETRPGWLGVENPQWPGDYQVAFANPDWQSIIFGTPQSYLDRIIAAGFDGVYLDRVDAYQDVEQTMPGAEDAMLGFVSRLADHARRLNPQFLIVLQNAEELLRFSALRQRLDGFAKEDFAFGHNNSTMANPPEMIRETLQHLRKARKSGITVFTLEYVDDVDKARNARKLAARENFLLHITERLLGRLSLDAPDTSAAPPADPAPKTP